MVKIMEEMKNENGVHDAGVYTTVVAGLACVLRALSGVVLCINVFPFTYTFTGFCNGVVFCNETGAFTKGCVQVISVEKYP